MRNLACLIALVLFASAASSSLSWWSIGLVNPTTPVGTLKPFPCDSYKNTLTESQKTLCFLNPYILSAAARGLWRGFGACNNLFGSDRFGNTCWNCTIYVGPYLLGQAVEATPNREREFIRMLMAASITYEIARACREKLIPDCHCAPSNIPFINRTENKLILAGCNVDMNWAAAYTMLIMNGSNDPLELHNIKVGIEFANRTFRASSCRGPLGSCSVEVRFLVPEPTMVFQDPQNVTRLQAAYRQAVWVNVDETGRQWPPNRVVFGRGSHNFCCTRNPSIGIPGTQGRKCNPSSDKPDSCDRLCCGRGYTSRTFYKTIKTYKLVESPPPAHLVPVYKTVMVDSHHCK